MAFCSYCDACYPTKQHLKQHLDTWRPCCIKYHSENPSATGFSPELEYPCTRCKIKFAWPPAVDDRNKQACCDHQDFFAPSETSGSETSNPETLTIGTQSQEKKGRISALEAIERAIRRNIALLQLGQYISPPCHFCREEDPVFWKSDEHKVCSKCKERYLDVHRLKYLQDNRLRKNNSSIQLAGTPQIANTPTSGDSSPPGLTVFPRIFDKPTSVGPSQHSSSPQPADPPETADTPTSEDSSQPSSPVQPTPEFAVALKSAPPAGYIPSHISKIEPCVQCQTHHAGECWTRDIEESCYSCVVYSRDCARRRWRDKSTGVQSKHDQS